MKEISDGLGPRNKNDEIIIFFEGESHGRIMSKEHILDKLYLRHSSDFYVEMPDTQLAI